MAVLKHRLTAVFLTGALEINLFEYALMKCSENGLKCITNRSWVVYAVLYSYPSISLQICLYSNHVSHLCLLLYLSQDLKPSNVAVNEDCELRVRLTLCLNLRIFYSKLWTSFKKKIFLSRRSLTLGWPDRQTMRWQGMLRLAGIERRRSCWTGCTTIRMVRCQSNNKY